MGEFHSTTTSALDVANYVLELAHSEKVPIDPITLQKIVYHCQCWALCEGQRLFSEPVEAWKWGPAVRTIHKAYSGSSRIREPDEPRAYELSADQMDLIHGVWNSLKGKHGFELGKATHKPGTAWHKARRELPESAPSDREIELEDMAAEAAELNRKAQAFLVKNWESVVRHQA